MTDRQIIPLAFEGHPIHIVDEDGTVTFVADDVCAALGVHVAQVRKLDEDEKGLRSMQTLRGMQERIVLTEAGVYTLALRCRDAMKPGTPPYRFRKWVTGVALPALRRGHEPGVVHQLDGKALGAFGGVLKKVLHKQRQEVIPAMVREEVMSGRFSVVEGVSALEVAEMAGYASGKRPRGATQFISRRLGRYHEDRAIPVRRSRHGSGKVRLFDESAARQWLRVGGQIEVDHYIAKRKGQGALTLVR